jgi:hypothetical protein
VPHVAFGVCCGVDVGRVAWQRNCNCNHDQYTAAALMLLLLPKRDAKEIMSTK